MTTVNLVNPARIINKDLLPGGEIRHTVNGENVSINNLTAVGSRIAADVSGNRFICQMIVPMFYKDKLVEDAHSKSILIEFLPRDEFDGLTGLVNQMVVYTWSEDYAICYVPQFDTAWRIDIGDNHQLIKKEDGFKLLGPNKGFDLIFPFHPLMGYAPPRVLLAWIEEGYESPKDALEKIKSLTTGEKLRQLSTWEYYGYNDSQSLMLTEGLIDPEDLKLLGDGH